MNPSISAGRRAPAVAVVPMKVVPETLGHSSSAITADTYPSVYPTVAAEAGRGRCRTRAAGSRRNEWAHTSGIRGISPPRNPQASGRAPRGSNPEPADLRPTVTVKGGHLP